MGGTDREVDKRRFTDPEAHQRRFELLAYIDATSRNGAEGCQLYVSDVAAKFGVTTETVRRHLSWLHDHKWISYPPSKRQVRKGNAGGRAHAVVTVRYRRKIGGVMVEDWLRWNQSEWLSPGRLVWQATSRHKVRAELKFEKRRCDTCGQPRDYSSEQPCLSCDAS